MSMIDKGSKPEITRELIDEIILRAKQERAEAIRQLFGFGFTVAKDAVRGALGRQDAPAGRPSAAARG